VLPKRLKQLRHEKGVYQKDVAKYLGITTSAYGYYEQGERQPDPNTITKLAEYYNVTTDYLLGRTNNKKESLDDEPSPQEVEEIFQNQVMYQGVPMTEEEKESVKEFIRLAIKTIRAKKKGENNNA